LIWPTIPPTKKTEHCPAERVHGETENVPASLLVQVTFPVGENPTTWAVQVETVPKLTVEGSQRTVIVVG